MKIYAFLKKSFYIVLLLQMMAGQAIAKEKVVLTTTELEPYIGKNILNNGYVHELVSEAFSRMGYETEIKYYPLARAKYIAEKGEADGFLPIHSHDGLHNKFSLSDPFPGDHIGLLKKKSLNIPILTQSNNNIHDLLDDLKEYRFGLLIGGQESHPEIQATFLNKQAVNTNLQLLDMLEKDRIDIIAIDRSSAADLMVGQRPHLIGQLEFFDFPFSESQFHIAFSNKSSRHKKLLRDFNLGLNLLNQDGTLKKILEKHGLHQHRKTLVIGALDNPDIQILKKLSSRFTKTHPEYKLEWRILDEVTLRKRLLADLALADEQFDVMMVGSYEGYLWSKNNWLVPFENLPEEYDLEDILKPVRDGFSYKGKLYTLPISAESTLTFYRKDLFEKAGISMPASPTYQEIMNFAAAIHDPENGIYGIGLRGQAGWGMNMAYISILVNTFGGRWFDENWKPTIDTKEWHEALTFYRDILKKYGHPDMAKNGWNENRKLFADGHLGIIIDSSALAGWLYDPNLSKIHNNIDFAPAPIAHTEKGSQWLWSWGFSIPTSSKLVKEAQKFITWATSKEYIQLVAKNKGWGSVPPGARYSTYNNEYSDAAPFAKSVLQAIEKADPKNFSTKPVPYKGLQFVAIPEFPAIGRAVGEKISAMLSGNISIDEALESAQKIVEQQMRRAGYYSEPKQ